jgi:hypothetical protein
MPMWFHSRIAQVAISVAFLSGLAGCSSLGLSSGGAFTADGLPKRQYLVGGGMYVQYTAPSDGRVYWVEETTRKVLEMKSVKAEEEVEFGSSNMDANGVKKTLGLDIKDTVFSVYFVPNEN